MKNVLKKMLLVCLVASLAGSVFGCNKPKEEEEIQIETISLDQTKTDLTFTYKQGPAVDMTEAEGDDAETPDGGDEVSGNGEDTPAYEEITEYVNVTDAEGQDVTDAEGAVQTEAIVVGTRPAATSAGGGEDGNTAATQAATAKYTPSYDTCKAHWLDMSQEGDYMFNGEFLVITFQINEDTPDGSYPVSIATTDIASWELVSYDPVIIDGEVAVNTEPASQEDASGSDFTLKVNSTAAKQGDLATVVIDLSNNPGFCGFIIDIQYDSNAMTIMDASGGSDFNKTVSSIT